MRRVIFYALLMLALVGLTYCNSAGDGNSAMDSVNNTGNNRATDNVPSTNTNTTTTTGTYSGGGASTGADTSRATNSRDSLQ